MKPLKSFQKIGFVIAIVSFVPFFGFGIHVQAEEGAQQPVSEQVNPAQPVVPLAEEPAVQAPAIPVPGAVPPAFQLGGGDEVSPLAPAMAEEDKKEVEDETRVQEPIFTTLPGGGWTVTERSETYDEEGNLITVDVRVHEYAKDATLLGSDVTVLTYDAATGNLIEQKEGHFSGEFLVFQTTTTYNSKGQTTGILEEEDSVEEGKHILIPTRSIGYGYDKDGKLFSRCESNHKTETYICFDSSGALLKQGSLRSIEEKELNWRKEN